MKLRMEGNSVRYRLSRSDVAKLLQEGAIEQAVVFAPDATLRYSLRRAAADGGLSMTYDADGVTVFLPETDLHQWATTEQVGVYGRSENGHAGLEIVLEKDFACLDRSDRENADTFPNPNLTC